MVVSALLACSAILVMRRQRGVNWRVVPIWAVMAAIWAWVWCVLIMLIIASSCWRTSLVDSVLNYPPFFCRYYIWYLVMAITSLISGPVAQLGSIYQALSLLFMYAAICLLFCTFYRLIHMTLGTTNGGRVPPVLRLIHWVIFGVIVALSIADFVIWIVYGFLLVTFAKVYEPMTIALYVLYWVASWEITALAILVFVRATRTGSVIKVSEMDFSSHRIADIMDRVPFLLCCAVAPSSPHSTSCGPSITFGGMRDHIIGIPSKSTMQPL